MINNSYKYSINDLKKIRRKKIALYLSGSRSDYGLMKNVLKELNQTYDIRLVLTGMHLSENFGRTYSEVVNDGFKIEGKIPVKIEKDEMSEMSDGIAKVIVQLNKIFEKLDVSFVIVLGDRWEALASAITAAYQRIPIVHIAGGDESGGIDNYNRMAISTFASYHFVENINHKKKLERFGVDKKRIFNVGAVAIDQIREKNFSNLQSVLKKYELNSRKPLILTTFHATFEELNNVGKYMKIILDALKNLGTSYEKIILYPTSDAGAQKIIKVIKNFKKDKSFHVFKNIPHDDYLALMSNASLMIGNSSSVFTEGMAFKVPSVNLGVRQKNRIQGRNIIDCDFNKNKIQNALNLGLSKRFKKYLLQAKNPYGAGRCAPQIHKILKNLDLNAKLTSL